MPRSQIRRVLKPYSFVYGSTAVFIFYPYVHAPHTYTAAVVLKYFKQTIKTKPSEFNVMRNIVTISSDRWTKCTRTCTHRVFMIRVEKLFLRNCNENKSISVLQRHLSSVHKFLNNSIEYPAESLNLIPGLFILFYNSRFHSAVSRFNTFPALKRLCVRSNQHDILKLL